MAGGKRKSKSATGMSISVDLPVEMVEQVKMDAERYERSLSYMLQWSWRLAKDDIKRLRGPV